MGRISPLPKLVASQLRSSAILSDISQIVDELVCNSLDAHSTEVHIYVDIRACYIKVEDDGHGINRDDFALLGERHATSKLHSLDELEAGVRTLGFRGEGLSSISDTGLLEVTSRSRGSPHTYRKILKNCRTLSLGLAGQQRGPGTTVVVRDVFYNQPVRRKHLHSSSRKVLQLVKDHILRLALIHPKVAFIFIDVERQEDLFHAKQAGSLSSRICDIFGQETRDSLQKIDFAKASFRFSGYISKQLHNLPRKDLQYFYINRRFVHRTPVHKLLGSVHKATCQQRESSASPAFVLNLVCPRSEYDITLDASKTYVEFKDWDPLLSFVEEILKKIWTVQETEDGSTADREIPAETLSRKRKWSRGSDDLDSMVGISSQLEARNIAGSIRSPPTKHLDGNKYSQEDDSLSYEELKTSIVRDPDCIMGIAEHFSATNISARIRSPEAKELAGALDICGSRIRQDIVKASPARDPECISSALKEFSTKHSIASIRSPQTKHLDDARDICDNRFFQEDESLSFEQLKASIVRDPDCIVGISSHVEHFSAENITASVRCPQTKELAAARDLCGSRIPQNNIEDRFSSEELKASPARDPDYISSALEEFSKNSIASIPPTKQLADILSKSIPQNIEDHLQSFFSQELQAVNVPGKSNVCDGGAKQVRVPKSRQKRSLSGPPFYRPRRRFDLLGRQWLLETSDKNVMTYGVKNGDAKISKWRQNAVNQIRLRPNACLEVERPILEVGCGTLSTSNISLVPKCISKEALLHVRTLDQVDKKFIAAVTKGILLLIDQHAADERIRLEEFRCDVLAKGRHARFLEDHPEEIILTRGEQEMLLTYREKVEYWGWRSRPVFNHSNYRSFSNTETCKVVLTAVPCIKGVQLTSADLVEYLRQLTDTHGSSAPPPAVRKVLNFKACRGAIMFGDALLPGECQQLVNGLKKTDLCFQCAHGRPTMVPIVDLKALRHRCQGSFAATSIKINDEKVSMSTSSLERWHGLQKELPTVQRAYARLQQAQCLFGVAPSAFHVLFTTPCAAGFPSLARPNSSLCTAGALISSWSDGVGNGASMRRTARFSPSASASASQEQEYEFRDEGRHLELRLQMPPEISRVTAKNVAVDAQDTSLKVALLSQQGVRTLLNVPRLYGKIKSAETMWYIDEDEVVLSLKKLDGEQAWPGLLEAWEFLGEGVANMVKGISIYIVGESTEINSAVAKELATALGYVPMETKQLMEQLLKSDVDELANGEGAETIAELEGRILSTLSKQLRVVVATLGGKQGAAARQKDWRYLYSGFTLWLSQSQAQDEAAAEGEAVKAKQEASSPYARAETVVALGGWEDGAARPAAEGCLRAIKYLIEADKELPGKKSLYLRLGARGDWPNIMPPGWDPAEPTSKAAAL